MVEALLLLLALACNLCGMAWLALAMKVHWLQVRGTPPAARGTVRALRVLGALALLTSLLLLLRVDHASMAALVWVMSMTVSVLLLAFTLAWRPRWLSLLVPARRPRPGPTGSHGAPGAAPPDLSARG
jgi:hypothetical protein